MRPGGRGEPLDTLRQTRGGRCSALPGRDLGSPSSGALTQGPLPICTFSHRPPSLFPTAFLILLSPIQDSLSPSTSIPRTHMVGYLFGLSEILLPQPSPHLVELSLPPSPDL